MTQPEIIDKLTELRNLHSETEIVEFKEAKTTYDFGKLGKYFSAISNEANLKGVREGWLVFGIEDKNRAVVGSNFRLDRAYLDRLKGEIAQKTTNGLTFIEIYEVLSPEGRVVLFQIPAAPRGIPIAWEGHYYARDGQDQCALNIEKQERIREQLSVVDWSAGICKGATLADLDGTAVVQARVNYKNKNPHLAGEVDTWNDETFLNKAKITIQGQITRAAILLLGKPESSHFLNPAVAQITWVLKDQDGIEQGYEHFSCPFLFAVQEVYDTIRNLRYRYMPHEGKLIPDEVDQYEPFNILEALHNCIAHQDYTEGGKINVVERADGYLIFSNLGQFLPGSVEKVLQDDAPPERYRNKFLADAMVNLKMIDTVGSGIRRIFINQRKKFFPMPDYDLSGGRVKVTLTGKVLDVDYAQVLARNPDLSLYEIIMLDKLQKRKPLTSYEVQVLRKRGLVEGRKHHLHISKQIAQTTGQQVEYSLAKGMDDEYYKKMILEHIRQFKSVARVDIERMILHKLPESLNEEQRYNKVKNLLQSLRHDNLIYSDANREWRLRETITL